MVPSVSENVFPPEQIRRQLERILAGPRFAGAQRTSSFLRFVVERTLAGRAEEIKELVLAAELYGRGSDYDPKADSVVRVEASRVRARLHDYYEQAGRTDPIRIEIPKGSYVPRFEACGAVSPVDPPAPIAAGRAVWALLAVSAVIAFVHLGPRPMDAEAMAAWNEGRELLRQDPHLGVSERGIPPTLERALERFEFAVARNPAQAGAWASLAEAYDYASAYHGRAASDDAQRAEAAARRAIALDPRLASGHAILATVQFYLRRDLDQAERSYRRALALEPRAPFTVVEFCDLLVASGRRPEAFAELGKARALLPRTAVLVAKQAELHLEAGDPAAAATAARLALTLQRDSGRASVALGRALAAQNQPAAAEAAFRQALLLNPRDRRALPELASLLASNGRREEALAVRGQLEQMHRNIRNCAYQLAVVSLALGDDGQARHWLDESRRSGQGQYVMLRADRRFDALLRAPGARLPGRWS